MLVMREFRKASRSDPTGFTIVCGFWSISLALAVLAPGSFFDAFPSFSLLKRLLDFWDISENAAGGSLVVLSFATFWSVTSYAHLPWRALTAFGSFAIWLLVGLAVVVGGGQLGVLNPIGLFCLTLAAGCLLASVQWMNQDWTAHE